MPGVGIFGRKEHYKQPVAGGGVLRNLYAN